MAEQDEDPSGASGNGGGGRKRKVARVLESYDLEELGPELEEAWTGDAGERASLRDLAERVNRRIIEAALLEAGEDPLPGEVDAVYEALGSGDAGAGVEQDVRGRLSRAGVDAERLESDLVSYQAIRTYLTEDRGAEYEQPESDPLETARERIQRLRGRLRAVTDQRVSDLGERGRLELGETQTLVQVQIFCTDCGRQFDIDELLDRGGCDCDVEET